MEEPCRTQQIVNEFLASAAKRDYATALPLVSDSIEYQNMMMPATIGKEAMQATLEAMLGICADSEWLVLRELSDGTTVMNERTDRFHLHGQWVDLPVMGVFTVTDGVITQWRDYFDLQTVMSAMVPPAS
jgi:limonene-1,2-epoxide hydrolase